MPAVSCYLNEKVLNTVRAKAKAENLRISRIISQAVSDEHSSISARLLLAKDDFSPIRTVSISTSGI